MERQASDARSQAWLRSSSGKHHKIAMLFVRNLSISYPPILACFQAAAAQLYEDQEEKEAWLAIAAEGGDAASQFEMSVVFNDDEATSFNWVLRAAAQGNTKQHRMDAAVRLLVLS